jgi:hypothetical protein
MKLAFILFFLLVNTNIKAQNVSELFNKLLNKFKKEVITDCDTNRVHNNDKNAKDMIAFLNKDFETTIFSKAL